MMGGGWRRGEWGRGEYVREGLAGRMCPSLSLLVGIKTTNNLLAYCSTVSLICSNTNWMSFIRTHNQQHKPPTHTTARS